MVSEAKKYGLEFTLLGRKFTLNHFPITLLENKQRKGKDQGRGRKSTHLIHISHYSDCFPLTPATILAFASFCSFYNSAGTIATYIVEKHVSSRTFCDKCFNVYCPL